VEHSKLRDVCILSSAVLLLGVCSLIAEHCATSGDVGRPTSQLLSHFPTLATPLGELEEHWWFNPSPQDNPNCAVTR